MLPVAAKCIVDQWNDESDFCQYRHKWGKFGTLYLLYKHGDLSFFNVFFETDIVKFTLKVNPLGIQPTNMQLVRMYSTDWMLVRHFCDALVYKDIRNLLKMLFIYSRAQDKTEYHTMEFHTLMLYHWATENFTKFSEHQRQNGRKSTYFETM